VTTGRNDEDGGNHYGLIQGRDRSNAHPIIALINDGRVECLDEK